MTEQEMKTFKELFSKYCRQEINKGHCEAGSCDICSVNNAYEEIFDRFADTEDDLDEDETAPAHGHWIICSDGYYPYCSECNKEPRDGERTKQCPNCGAIMDL